MSFRERYSFQQRQTECINILKKYPDKIPIICEKNYNITDNPNINKNKYLVSDNLTIGQFLYVLRKRISIDPNQALYLYINNNIPSINKNLKEIYYFNKNEDGFLYITYQFETTFG